MSEGTYKQWTLQGQNGIESLVSGTADLPTGLGDHDVLVKIHAASLDFRDIVLAKVSTLANETLLTLLISSTRF